MRPAAGIHGRCKCFGFRKYLFWFSILSAHAMIQEGSSADSATGHGNYQIEVTTAEMEYKNPEYMGEGAYFRSLRKSRNAPREIYAFYPFIKDLPTETEAAFTVYQKLSNKWVESFIKGGANVCTALVSKLRFYNFVFDKSNFQRKCPVKKGNYTMILDGFNKAGLPPGLPRNEWKVKLRWHADDVTFFIATFQVKLDVKRSRRPPEDNH